MAAIAIKTVNQTLQPPIIVKALAHILLGQIRIRCSSTFLHVINTSPRMKEHLISIFYMAIAGVLLWLFLPQKYTVNIPLPFANSISAEQTLDRFTVADGYSVSLHADKVPGVRAMVITETGDLIVSQPNKGAVSLIPKEGIDSGRLLLAKGLNRPHGLALHDGFLYIAETDAVLRVPYDAKQQKFTGIPVTLIKNSFPGGGNHWTRTVKVSPNNKLFVSVGSSCNVCIERSAMRASIIQYELDGSQPTLYAEGLRNTVGFDWQPSSHLLYGVDNGRDLLGDDTPPEELNQISLGKHYGWPYYYGNNELDTNFTDQIPSKLNPYPTQHQFTAHSAPLSLLFLRYSVNLPNTALVSLHGSWNRSEKSGYKVVAVSFLADGSIEQHDFLSGFLQQNGSVLGRPVDLVEDSQGNIYISEDYVGRIYKVSPNLQ